ncbi:hypothetical protein RI129_008895 [Pyrocoelia pectoralis]|uniref:Uncharacterized protein n=1 Tax=Pyrocoelia pectoralis TaxID=417401 RepID=A0AAN7ZKI8_9COLE
MFTLPPRPPKDYILREVSLNQASAPELTPTALPRATQASIKQYCYPIAADDNEPADITKIDKINDQVLNNWTKDAKAEWVAKPGIDAYRVTDMHKKFSVIVEPSYDGRYLHRPRVLQRSYKYEFDCMEEARLQKLGKKIKQEEEEDRQFLSALTTRQESKGNEEVPATFQPPFWWKEPNPLVTSDRVDTVLVKPEKSIYQTSYLRWQPVPKPFEEAENDPCRKREILAQFRLPFKNEAANWYYKHYPPPNIKFRPEKFAQ